jgi:ATP-binding cassette, subfamily B, bacterial
MTARHSVRTTDDPGDTRVISGREIFREFWPLLRSQRRLMMTAALALTLATAAETASIWLFGRITDGAVLAGRLSAFWLPAAAWLVLALLGGLASLGGQYAQAKVSQNFLLELRGRLLTHLQKMSPDFFAAHPAGDVVARFTGDIGAVEALVASGVVQTFTSGLGVIFFTGAVFYIRWDLALIAMTAAPFFVLTFKMFSRSTRKTADAEREANGDLAGVVEENVSAMALVRSSGTQRDELRRVSLYGFRWMRASLAEMRVAAVSGLLAAMIETLAVLLIIGVGTWEISAGRLTVGGLLSFAAFLGYLFGPVHELGTLSITVSSAASAGQRILELLATRPAVVEQTDARPLVELVGELRFERVSFQYPDASRPSLHDVSFTVHRGRLTVVMGESGAGKSTVARLLTREYDPSAGQVRLDGRDLRDFTIDSLRSAFAVVHQNTILLRGTLWDNIVYGSAGTTVERVVAACRVAGLHDMIEAMPEGYQTEIGEDGSRLSGGQRQRVAFARALVRDAPILVLDEPTAALDAVSARDLIAPMRRLAAGRTTLLVTHDPRLAVAADEIVLLSGGQVAERGTHESLLSRDGLYARLYRAATPVRARTSGPVSARTVHGGRGLRNSEIG